MKRLGVAITLSFILGVSYGGLYNSSFSDSIFIQPLVTSLCIMGLYLFRNNKILFILVCCISFFFSGIQRRSICSESSSMIEEKIESWGMEARGFMQGRLEKSIGNPQDRAVANALLLGDRSGLDRKTKAAFRNAGISHALALSGMHVGIIWGIVCALFAFFRWNYRTRFWGFALSCIVILVYAVCTGLSPSVSRACIMLVLWKLCELISGSRDRLGSILVAALVITLFNPMAIESISFQLSFLAVGGIVFIYPVIEDSIDKVFGKRRRLSSAIFRGAGVSLSCQIATFPLILLYFGKISGNFLISNIVSAPLVAFSVCGSAISAALGGVPHLGEWAGELSSLIIETLRKVVMFLGS